MLCAGKENRVFFIIIDSFKSHCNFSLFIFNFQFTTMPVNPAAKLVQNLLDLKSIEQKLTRNGHTRSLTEAAQDQIFGNMSAEEKIRLMSRFYRFARSLRNSHSYGTRKASR